VAGIRIEEESDRYADPSQYAQDKGLFVLTPLENTTLFNSEVNKAPFSNGVTLSGEGMVVILNDEKFKPKEW